MNLPCLRNLKQGVSLIGLVVLVGPTAFGGSHVITKVAVMNAEHKTIKNIVAGEELDAFNKHWQGKKQLKDTPLFSLSPRHLTLNLVVDGKISLWLYEPEGKVRVLTKGPTSDFVISDPKGFNDLLGVSKP